MGSSKDSDFEADMAEIEEKMAKINKEWEEGLLNFEKAMGMSHKEMSKKFENPQNFSKEEWADIEKEREACYAEMEKVLGKEDLKKYLAEVEKSKKKKLSKTSSRSGKAKWIPMK